MGGLIGEFADWGSHAWSVGPSLSLPQFDRGRRKGIVQLRELEPQEAAVNCQKTVLKAWQEIGDALNTYAADRLQLQEQLLRVGAANEAYLLAQARFNGGATDFLAVLDTPRGYLQARQELATTQGRLGSRFVAVNKCLEMLLISSDRFKRPESRRGTMGVAPDGQRRGPEGLAEAQGFEPWIPCGMPVFKTGAIDHSAKLPI